MTVHFIIIFNIPVYFRLIFGTTKYFLFINPKERDSSKIQYPHFTFDQASEEVAKKSGFDVSGSGKSAGMSQFVINSFSLHTYRITFYTYMHITLLDI